jgi:hypothetical protein
MGAFGILNLGIPSLLFSQEQRPHLFVHFHINGGAHSILGPGFISQQEIEKRVEFPLSSSDYYRVIRDEDAIVFGDQLVGPSMVSLEPWFSRMCIFDGIMMKNNSVDHQENLFYMQTGSRKSSGFLAGVHVNSNKVNLPYAMASNFTATDNVPGAILNLSNISNLQRESKPFGYDAFERGEYLPEDSTDISKLQRFQNVQKFLSKKQELMNGTEPGFQTFIDIVAGYLTGQFASVTLNTQSGGNIDCHGEYSRTAVNSLMEHYTEVSSFLSFLNQIETHDGRSLIDDTTVLVTTDFSRTAWKEGDDGAGHNPWTNAAIVFSSKLRGGIKIGKSAITSGVNSTDQQSKFHSLPYDFKNGRVLSYEEFISMTLGSSKGLDRPLELGLSKENVHLITPEVVINTIGMAINPNYQSKFFIDRYIKEALI